MKKILVPEKDGKRLIDFNDIVYCEAQGKYSKMLINGSGKTIVCKSLGELEAILSQDCFCRIHRKYLVNLNFLEKVSTNGKYIIELKSDIHIPIAFRRKKQVLKCIEYFFGE
ncbi:MAG: LytTR family transcriptional regulator [Bacteroidales bacterium]|nr:LytTR family transcriptional regulator [Bacteroidales bacterium]